MLINVMRAKLHRLTVTQADLNYIGGISLDPDLIEAAGLVEGEKVQIVNINNGERIETYVITGERGMVKCASTAQPPPRSARRRGHRDRLRHDDGGGSQGVQAHRVVPDTETNRLA